MNTYDIGDKVRLSATFTNSAGAAADPDVVKFKIKPWSGVEVSYTHGVGEDIVKDSVGNYHFDYSPLVGKRHDYRWVGSGTIFAASEDAFKVRESAFNSPL